MSDGTRRAIVVGAGIVGVCAGLELQRRGWTVTIVDRLEPGEACSFGNAGILASESVVPLAVPGIQRDVPRMLLDREGPLVIRLRSLPKTLPWLLHFRRAANLPKVKSTSEALKALNNNAVDLHEALAKEAGVPDLVQPTQYLYVARNAAALDVNALSWRLRREHGYATDVFDGPALQEIEPALSPAYTRGIRMGRIGRTTNPFRLTQSYAALFRRKGGEIVSAEVQKLAPDGARVGVETSAGRFEADTVVVAAGAWSMALLRPLGLKLPLIAERGYHMTFANPGVAVRHVLSEAERHFAVNSMEMGLRIAGTEEICLADDPPSWRRAEILKRFASQMFPSARLDDGTRWTGPRPGTPDSLPAIGPVPGYPNIFIAAGHGHLGLTGGPNTGRIVAALASNERLNIPLAPYAPDRFSSRQRGSDPVRAAANSSPGA